jgi:uncharacterized protein YndB with AHSA1/START domain
MATLHHQLWIDAPVSQVYEALASAEGLGGWWAPHTSRETSDGIVLSHSPGPAHGEVEMKVVDATPDARIEWEIISTHPERSPASAWTGTHIVFELSPAASPGHWVGMEEEGRTVTLLKFYHAGWDEESEFLGFCNYAWGATLEILRQWCESRGTDDTSRQ